MNDKNGIQTLKHESLTIKQITYTNFSKPLFRETSSICFVSFHVGCKSTTESDIEQALGLLPEKRSRGCYLSETFAGIPNS